MLSDDKYLPGSKVDIYDEETSKWRTGRIQHKTIEAEETYSIFLDGTCDKEIKIQRSSKKLAPYMTHTINYNEIEILPLYNRYSNQDGIMKFFGLPQLLAIGIWSTCRQIANEIAEQMKGFCGGDAKMDRKTKIFMNIVGNDIRGKREGKDMTTSVFTSPRIPNLFTISMIQINSNICAICSSKKISTHFEPKKCKGCNILDYHNEYIKDLVNNFRDVAISIEWRRKEDYTEPMMRGDKPNMEQQKSVSTLEDCINIFTSTQSIPEYNCNKCKKQGTAELRVFISKLPDILIIHLKRFLFADNFVEKLDADIDFPLEKLNMIKWLDGNLPTLKVPSTEYDLYGMTNHLSHTAMGGHYTAYIHSNTCKETWIECNDVSLRRLANTDVKTKNAYLLFYKRRILSGSNIINLTYKTFT